MTITESTEIGSRNILADGQIQVRTDSIILKDGVEISRTYHRHVIAPGDDVSREDVSVQRIAKAEHTPAKIAAYKLTQAEISA
jgi:hypothetical protein